MTDASAPPRTDAPSSILHRALRIFGDVGPGDVHDVLVMFSSAFLLLVSYYVLKTVREPLILATGGAELKSYAAGAQAAVLLAYVPWYGRLAASLPVHRLVMRVNVAMAAVIQLFVLGRLLVVPYVGFAFYVFVGIFSLTLIAQFWSFANDVYRKEDGDRLFPVIAVGATAGAPVGAALASWLFTLGIRPYVMMEIATALLLAHTWLYSRVRRSGTGGAGKAKAAAANGFSLVLTSPYLRLIALLFVLLNVINTTGEYILASLVTRQANALAAADATFAKGAFIGAFYGGYFFWVNVASVALQMFVVSRLVKKLGMAGALFTLPTIALGAYGLAMTGAGLALVRWIKTAENAGDYSVMNTAKQMLWLPTSREEKYAAKQAIDTFFVRCGDMLSAGVIFAATHWLTMSTEAFAATNVALVLVVMVVAWRLLLEHRRLTAPAAGEVRQ